ncbi:hypothetical protein K3495_g6674 [Podosphaera aphanis]|nr:hypothetical protein K3495_g6674 [Podosphaera aphanis]
MLVYVDEIAAAANDDGKLDWFFKALSQRFNAKNLGEIEKILGYLSAALDQFGITHAKHTSKKIPAADYENLRQANRLDERINAAEYQRGFGKVMYAMVLTRPDIAFVVGRLSQFMKDPARLRFGPWEAYSQQFAVYTDADWALDKMHRKSISGGVCMYYGGPISWSSKKNSVTTSSAEVEYVSQAMYAKQGQWTAQIFRDLGMSQVINANEITVQIYGDNQGALALFKNPHLHERSKHIDICHHFVHDMADKGKLVIDYVPTSEMIADRLTKPLQRVAFERFKNQIGLAEGYE